MCCVDGICNSVPKVALPGLLSGRTSSLGARLRLPVLRTLQGGSTAAASLSVASLCSSCCCSREKVLIIRSTLYKVQRVDFCVLRYVCYVCSCLFHFLCFVFLNFERNFLLVKTSFPSKLMFCIFTLGPLSIFTTIL